MTPRIATPFLAILGALMLSGCYIVKPRIVTAYDDECEVGFRKMVLTVDQVGSLPVFCSSGDCGEAVLFGVLATSATAVVSGSIVVVGNTVFWMEKRGRCDVKEVAPVPVPHPAPAKAEAT